MTRYVSRPVAAIVLILSLLPVLALALSVDHDGDPCATCLHEAWIAALVDEGDEIGDARAIETHMRRQHCLSDEHVTSPTHTEAECNGWHAHRIDADNHRYNSWRAKAIRTMIEWADCQDNCEICFDCDSCLTFFVAGDLQDEIYYQIQYVSELYNEMQNLMQHDPDNSEAIFALTTWTREEEGYLAGLRDVQSIMNDCGDTCYQ